MIGAVILDSDHIGWLPARLGVELNIDQEVPVFPGPNVPCVEKRLAVDFHVAHEAMKLPIFVFPPDRLSDDDRSRPCLSAALTKLDPIPALFNVDSLVN